MEKEKFESRALARMQRAVASGSSPNRVTAAAVSGALEAALWAALDACSEASNAQYSVHQAEYRGIDTSHPANESYALEESARKALAAFYASWGEEAPEAF